MTRQIILAVSVTTYWISPMADCFAAEFMGVLTTALRYGGTVQRVAVYKIQSEEIATRISEDSQASSSPALRPKRAIEITCRNHGSARHS